MKTATVVVNWNSGRWLARCLDSLESAAEIVVVDNASEDDSIELASKSHATVRFILNNENRGFAAGVNQGFHATSSPYVLVLNPDVQATPGAIQQLEGFLDSSPHAGAVGGYVNPNYLPRRLATPRTVILENLGIRSRSTLPQTTEVEQAAAAALMIRREAYSSIGGFDEQFQPAWYEDVDFCRRLRAAGWQTHFLQDARFLHEGGYSARALGPSLFASAYYRNQLRYVRKHFGLAASLAVRGSIVAGMAGRMVARPTRSPAYLKVIAGALGRW